MLSKALANLDELFDSGIAVHLAFEKKQILFRDTHVLRSSRRNIHRIRMCHEELGVCSLERICHLFYIVCRRCTRYYATDSKNTEHGDRVPDGILTEKGNGLSHFKTILSDQGG